MDNSYSNSLVDSVKKYVEGLQYLAKNNKKDLRALHLYEIVQDLYAASTWFSFTTEQVNFLKTFMNELVLYNSGIILPVIEGFIGYTNVNTYQTDYTWDRLWDDTASTTIYDLDLLMYPDEMIPEKPF